MNTIRRIVIWYEDNVIGKRTYIIAGITGLLTLLQQFGVVSLSQDQLNAVYGILAALGLGTIRSAISNSSGK